MDSKLKGKIDRLRMRVGYNGAFNRLMAQGISPSTVSKLLAGTYPNEPKMETMNKIDAALKEVG